MASTQSWTHLWGKGLGVQIPQTLNFITLEVLGFSKHIEITVVASAFTVSRTDTVIGFMCSDLAMSTTPSASSGAESLPGPSRTSVSMVMILAADAQVIAGYHLA